MAKFMDILNLQSTLFANVSYKIKQKQSLELNVNKKGNFCVFVLFCFVFVLLQLITHIYSFVVWHKYCARNSKEVIIDSKTFDIHLLVFCNTGSTSLLVDYPTVRTSTVNNICSTSS